VSSSRNSSISEPEDANGLKSRRQPEIDQVLKAASGVLRFLHDDIYAAMRPAR